MWREVFKDAAFECSSFHLIRFQSLLHSSLLVVSPRISTADEGFNLIQLRPQSAPGILPDRPLLKRGKSHASILNLCVQELHWKLMAYSKRGASNLQPPLSSDFLSQSLLLQRSGSDFQLKPLILLTLEWFWFTLEQTLHKSQVRPEDPQELLDQRETGFKTERERETITKTLWWIRQTTVDGLNISASGLLVSFQEFILNFLFSPQPSRGFFTLENVKKPAL